MIVPIVNLLVKEFCSTMINIVSLKIQLNPPCAAVPAYVVVYGVYSVVTTSTNILNTRLIWKYCH